MTSQNPYTFDRNRLNPGPTILGFNAQGEPISVASDFSCGKSIALAQVPEGTKSILERNTTEVKDRNNKYSDLKRHAGNFEAANQDSVNTYNDYFCNLDEAFGTCKPKSISVASDFSCGKSISRSESSLGTKSISAANSSVSPHVMINPQASHKQLVNAFETASMSVEDTGDMPQQQNPLVGSFPIHMPRNQQNVVAQNPSNPQRFFNCGLCGVQQSQHVTVKDHPFYIKK